MEKAWLAAMVVDGGKDRSVDFYVIFSFDRSALFKGQDVIEL
jgi:hypothetical protein